MKPLLLTEGNHCPHHGLQGLHIQHPTARSHRPHLLLPSWVSPPHSNILLWPQDLDTCWFLCLECSFQRYVNFRVFWVFVQMWGLPWLFQWKLQPSPWFRILLVCLVCLHMSYCIIYFFFFPLLSTQCLEQCLTCNVCWMNWSEIWHLRVESLAHETWEGRAQWEDRGLPPVPCLFIHWTAIQLSPSVHRTCLWAPHGGRMFDIPELSSRGPEAWSLLIKYLSSLTHKKRAPENGLEALRTGFISFPVLPWASCVLNLFTYLLNQSINAAL